MKDTIISFNLGKNKQFYLRRIDTYGTPILTKNKDNARKFDKNDLQNIIQTIKRLYNITDIKLIKD